MGALAIFRYYSLSNDSRGVLYKCHWCEQSFSMPIIRDIHELKHIKEKSNELSTEDKIAGW